MSMRRAAALLVAVAWAGGCADDAPPAAQPETSSPATAPTVPGVDPGGPMVDRDTSSRGEVRALIGLVPSSDATITDALAAGARRALDASRAAGGPDLELRVAEPESRWSAAAEAAVRMALDEGAVAIITPPERERAHAIAQMGTRAQVPIVSTSPWATVMQAGSTWVTSVVPTAGEPRVDPAADWEQAGHAAARAVLDAVREHGLVRSRWD